jgi:hypothetical protein
VVAGTRSTRLDSYDMAPIRRCRDTVRDTNGDRLAGPGAAGEAEGAGVGPGAVGSEDGPLPPAPAARRTTVIRCQRLPG